MWCFVRVFFLLVRSRVFVNNRIWECLFCLWDVFFYVCVLVFVREYVLLMVDVIEEFCDFYRNCFLDEVVKFKFYYIFYYLYLFMVFGFLVYL